MNQTCLHACHLEAGATIVDFHGWAMPVRYGSIPEEHLRVRASAGLFDLCHMGRLEITGPDAEAHVNEMVTVDVPGLAPGAARYGFVLNEQGGIIDDLIVYRLPDRLFLVVNASNRERVIAWFEEHRGSHDATLTDLSADLAMIAIQGPRSAELVLSALGLDDDRLEQMPYYRIDELELEGRPGRVATTGYTGERGFELFLPSAEAPALWRRLLESSGEALGPVGLGARDTLRVEAGMPLYGNELTEDTHPFDVGLGPVVKLDKGPFVGREALLAIRDRGPSKKLIGLRVDSRRVARSGMAVLRGGQPVGVVTSGIPSPTLGYPVALASVDIEVSDPEGLEVDLRGKPVPVIPVPLPFFSNTRKRSSKAL